MAADWNTRLSLIQRAKNTEDQSAWDDFVKYYKSFIEVVLYESRVPLTESQDLCQDILIKVWKGLPKYEYQKGKAKFRTWLSMVIKNAMINHMKKLARKKPNSEVPLNEAITVEIDESDIEKIIKNEWMNHLTSVALDNVSQAFSGQAIEVFKLSLKGRTAKEISAELSITEDSVFVLRSRVKSKVVKEIELLRSEIEFD
ncbi:MAG: sigma-70 family RNA polymerase sigma factor [Lentisphaeraceae bacterium]|nr:sigma-70 family RNA polymerase sigma factor [Lentisphaeraceae bacterium]